jgi:hypothetical protein
LPVVCWVGGNKMCLGDNEIAKQIAFEGKKMSRLIISER